MKLERGDYGNPDISVLLPWAKVAKRIGYLIDNQQFLRSADYSRMPEYERERIAGKVISFMQDCQKKLSVRLSRIF